MRFSAPNEDVAALSGRLFGQGVNRCLHCRGHGWMLSSSAKHYRLSRSKAIHLDTRVVHGIPT